MPTAGRVSFHGHAEGLTAVHACLCMQLHNETGFSKLKELTRPFGSKTALLEASAAAKSDDWVAARKTWNAMADHKLAGSLMLKEYLLQDLCAPHPPPFHPLHPPAACEECCRAICLMMLAVAL